MTKSTQTEPNYWFFLTSKFIQFLYMYHQHHSLPLLPCANIIQYKKLAAMHWFEYWPPIPLPISNSVALATAQVLPFFQACIKIQMSSIIITHCFSGPWINTTMLIPYRRGRRMKSSQPLWFGTINSQSDASTTKKIVKGLTKERPDFLLYKRCWSSYSP